MLVVDDLGWSDVGYRYYSDYSTPNIDYLHSIGVDLVNYHVHKLCTPTRSSLMNGRYSWQNGCGDVFGAQTLQHLPFNHLTLPQYLTKYTNNSYDNRGFGKWHLGYAAYNMTPIERGFKHYTGYWMGSQDYYTHEESSNLDFFIDSIPDWSAYNVYSTNIYDNYTQYTIDDFVSINNKNNKNSSLFLYAAYQTVHTPIKERIQIF